MPINKLIQMSEHLPGNKVKNIFKLPSQKQKVPDIDSCYDSCCLFIETNSR